MVNVGIDLHKTQFTVCVREANGRQRFRTYATTDEGYRLFLEQAAAWREAGQQVRVGVESTGNTRYFKGRMEEAGIGVVVINTLKFKVVNESVNKTDRHEAARIAEFLEKDMLPESNLCGRVSEQLRLLLKARTTLVRACVVMKNQIHALLTAEGMEDTKASLQSKRGRQRVLDALKERAHGLVVQPLFETIERLEENVKGIEEELRRLTVGDWMVELLLSIPGCGQVCAWRIRAYTDEIARFATAKKYAAYAGLAPWVRDSNETIRHGRITKRGPEELRTALIQVVMGLRRLKERTLGWRLMERHEAMKKRKGSGKTIVATARKLATIIWHMLSEKAAFDLGQMVDRKLAKKAREMSGSAEPARAASARREPVQPVQGIPVEEEKSAGVASEKRKKAG